MAPMNNPPNSPPTAILVEESPPERPGEVIACGLIGPWLVPYEIRLESGTSTDGYATVTYQVAHYYVGDTEVPREVYLDCLATEDKDRWCHGCMGDNDEVAHSCPEGSEVGPS